MCAKTLVTTVGAVCASATRGGLASRRAESAWHARLKKPSFQPPLDHLGHQHRGQARTYAALLSTRTWQLNRDD
jgi:tryptophan-rich sensory protein